MKSIIQWLKTIKHPLIREKALELYDPHFGGDDSAAYGDLYRALLNAFEFEESGDEDFWTSYADHLGNSAKFPFPDIPPHWVNLKATIPDTGSRRQWDTGAVRDASEGKPQITFIYPEAVRRLAQRGTDGAKKYDDHNWTKGIPLSAYVDSLYRHLNAYQMGDGSEDHLGAIMWNAMGLMYTEDAVGDGRLPKELLDLFPWGPKDA